MSEKPITAGWGALDLRLARLWLAWSATGLVLLDQHDRRFDAEKLARALPELEPGAQPSDVPALLAEPLLAYARGEPIDPATIPVDLRGTDFHLRVWTAL